MLIMDCFVFVCHSVHVSEMHHPSAVLKLQSGFHSHWFFRVCAFDLPSFWYSTPKWIVTGAPACPCGFLPALDGLETPSAVTGCLPLTRKLYFLSPAGCGRRSGACVCLCWECANKICTIVNILPPSKKQMLYRLMHSPLLVCTVHMLVTILRRLLHFMFLQSPKCYWMSTWSIHRVV